MWRGEERTARGGVISRLIDSVRRSYLIASRKRRARTRALHSRNVMHACIHALLAFFSHGCSLAERIKARARAPHGAYALRRDTMHTHARACVYANTRGRRGGEREREVNVYITFCKKATPIDKNLPLSARRVLFFRIVQFTIPLSVSLSFSFSFF